MASRSVSLVSHGPVRFAASRASARRRSAEAKPQRVGVEAGPQLEQAHLAALLELFQRLEIFGAQSRCRRSPAVRSAASGGKHDLVEIRQRRSVGRLAPVMRIASEDARSERFAGAASRRTARSRESDGDRATAGPAQTARRTASRASADRARGRPRAAPSPRSAPATLITPAAVNGRPPADVRPGRSFTVYIRLILPTRSTTRRARARARRCCD